VDQTAIRTFNHLLADVIWIGILPCQPTSIDLAASEGFASTGPPMPLSPSIWPYLTPILLLVTSNVFMTLAWYGHLSFKSKPLYFVILISWGIAFVEYCCEVTANRWDHGTYSAAELKTIQEVITLIVFAIFSVLYLKESLGWNHLVGFALIAAGAFFIFQGRP